MTRIDPREYIRTHGESSLIDGNDLPADILNEFKEFSSEYINNKSDNKTTNESRVDLVGDLYALRLVEDLDKVGLGEYADLIANTKAHAEAHTETHVDTHSIESSTAVTSLTNEAIDGVEF